MASTGATLNSRRVMDAGKDGGHAMALAAGPASTNIAQLGVPWERVFGYAQAVRAGDVIYISGQLSHGEDGQLIGAAPVDAAGRVTDVSNMEVQMREAYANAVRVLAQFGATLDHVVAEVIYALDVDAAFAVAGTVRREAYGREMPRCASTLVGTTRLAFPAQLVEISMTAVMTHYAGEYAVPDLHTTSEKEV
jgi:enamine deaminase RidA (YjgF/YER057c/UK114 family)